MTSNRGTRLALAVGLLMLPGILIAYAQGSAADYERSANLSQLTRGKVFRTQVKPNWLPGGTSFWYRIEVAQDKSEHVLVDTVAATRKAVPVDVLRELGVDVTKSATNLPSGRSRSRSRARETSPDGKWQALIREHNVLVRNLDNGEEAALSMDGAESDPYEPRFYWSPDSRKLVVMQATRGEERKIHLIESSPKDQLQPKLHTFSYAKPGDRMPVPRPRLFSVEREQPVAISGEMLFTNAWSISNLRWRPDSTRFTFLHNERGHQVLRVIAVDVDAQIRIAAETNRSAAAASNPRGRQPAVARAIVDEQSKTFIDYAHKEFTHVIDETDEVIWMSERDGWNHLYLYDSENGKLKQQITRGEWVVRGVEEVDEVRRQIWFRAGGIRPQQDPYHVHLCRINFDGTGLVVLTEGDGTHTWEFSPDRRFLIDTWSRVDHPPVTELRRTDDGKLVCELERADWRDLIETGWTVPERFAAKGRDGKTDVFGVIMRPMRFDKNRKYPVIEQIYAGPQGAFVPKSFSAHHRMQELAELGFIVVQIDGMGTSYRSKAFHDVCWKNLGDAGFPDRIAWMKAAAQTRPEMNLSRVGIYGGSAGGQNALRGMLDHGDFYKVCVADCGCHDNRMDKIWWNELWMGWPLDESYSKSSNVTDAHKLTGKLLLIVGELDRNVDPASTMQVANALVKADKDFDLLVMPGTGHGAAGSPYARRRQNDFFVRHLLGLEPRWRANN
jgi:dipeptidyl-peptidase 4